MKKINFYYGLGDKASNYKALSKYLNIIKIDWNNPERVKVPKNDVAVGFSMGCFLALDYAEIHKVKKLVLCSVPPCEKIGKIKADEIIFMVGSKEKFGLQNIRRIYKTLKCNKKSIIVVRGAGHKIAGNYKKKLLEVINQDK